MNLNSKLVFLCVCDERPIRLSKQKAFLAQVHTSFIYKENLTFFAEEISKLFF